MSSVMKELTTFLGVSHVTSSAYHPQTNGCLERVHGTFKSILKKSISNKCDWVQQIPFVLFVLRQMPSSDHGLSPFELIYGLRSRTPLEALYFGLNEFDGKNLKTGTWVNDLADKLQLIRDEAALATAHTIERRKENYDKNAKERNFQVGEKVRYRIPGKLSALAESWEGPFIIQKKLGEVNYQIQKEGVKKEGKVTHINNLMKFTERGTVNRLDIVSEEEEEEVIQEVSGKQILKDRCENYNEDELKEVLKKYEVCLRDEPGNTKVTELKIDTGNHRPVQCQPYSVPMSLRGKVKQELENLEKSGIIKRSNSKWCSPMIPVKKPDGSIRICGDFRKLNAITTTEPYCIPRLEELLSKVGDSAVLSKIDLAKGFHQVSVYEEDSGKLTIVTPFGKWRYVKMPFGVASAPATFQKLMDIVLKDCTEYSCVYIDDILIWSTSWKQHLEDLNAVFAELKKAGLTCKPTKCQFGMTTLQFLGHEIGNGKISVPTARVMDLKKFPKPKTKKQVRRFLGTVNYYRKFVKNFSVLQQVLTPATTKNAPTNVIWSKEMGEAFAALCNCVSEQVKLCIPVQNDKFVLETDASANGIGAVLSVMRGNNKQTVAFFSKQLHGAQKKYSAQELEGLALYQAIQHFSFYLYGSEFSVITDHCGLEKMMSRPQENNRILRWALKLSNYRFTITYRPGKENLIADTLSRAFEESISEATTPSRGSQQKKGEAVEC